MRDGPLDLLTEDGDPVLTADGRREQVVVVAPYGPDKAIVRPANGVAGSEFVVDRNRLGPPGR